MGWWYKPPSVFPATYLASLRAAASQPGEALPFYSSEAESDCRVVAERFRYFRWCIRKPPIAAQDLYLITEAYELRTKLTQDEVGWILWLTAKPTKLSEFTRLNPELAFEVLANVKR